MLPIVRVRILLGGLYLMGKVWILMLYSNMVFPNKMKNNYLHNSGIQVKIIACFATVQKGVNVLWYEPERGGH